jgi:hypothetical protein
MDFSMLRAGYVVMIWHLLVLNVGNELGINHPLLIV